MYVVASKEEDVVGTGTGTGTGIGVRARKECLGYCQGRLTDFLFFF